MPSWQFCSLHWSTGNPLPHIIRELIGTTHCDLATWRLDASFVTDVFLFFSRENGGFVLKHGVVFFSQDPVVVNTCKHHHFFSISIGLMNYGLMWDTTCWDTPICSKQKQVWSEHGVFPSSDSPNRVLAAPLAENPKKSNSNSWEKVISFKPLQVGHGDDRENIDKPTCIPSGNLT